MSQTAPTFEAKIESVYDGDTLHVALSYAAPAPFDVELIARRKLRLAGINCPELSTVAGLAARDFTRQWLTKHAAPYAVTFRGEDKYNNRIDGRLVAADGACLNDDLLAAGQAVPMKA